MSQKQETGGEKETGRLESFSDGVFAVAITLLVIDLKVPQVDVNAASPSLGLAQALLEQWPSYLTFVTSFATILIMWVNHHTLFKLIQRTDTHFLFINGFLLLLVTSVPFPTALVSQYLTTPAAKVACAVYAGVFVIINIAYNLLWWSASSNQRLLKSSVSQAQVQKLTRNYALGFPLYLLAMLLAFWNAYVSLGLCSFLWMFWVVTGYEKKSFDN
jgi:uncharacterized membrane protein